LKTVNLISLANALTSEISDIYTNYVGIKPKKTEIPPFVNLCKKLLSLGIPVTKLNNFFFGYTIPQIGKEFDLIRIGNNFSLNIEIKSISKEAKIAKQLVLNKRYLSNLSMQTHLYSYISETDTFYSLDVDNNLITVEPETVKQSILEQNVVYLDNLDTLFEASKFLVSPFNATEDFIADRYFLTPHQDNIKKNIECLFNRSFGNIVSIEGGAGTGKSLLLYDYAKQMLKRDSKPLIVHVAKLNKGHNNLINKYNFHIYEIKDFMKDIEILQNFSCVCIDESQRLRPLQLNRIIEYVETHRINCIFAYDSKQTLSKQEHNNKSVDKIRAHSVQKHRLTNSIRTNTDLAVFIKSVFDQRNGPVGNLNNVTLVYFNEFHEEALNYLIGNQRYKFIRYTPSIYSNVNSRLFCYETPHEIIGQEFDDVLVYMGPNFYYDDKGLLCARNLNNNPYDFLSMLYQTMTRARNRLEIVVIGNPEIFKVLSNILS
jgi:hypothetical protein